MLYCEPLALRLQIDSESTLIEKSKYFGNITEADNYLWLVKGSLGGR